MKRERLVYFDYLRALTIFLVIAGHCFGNWNADTLPEQIAVNLIQGATAMFVFISGFFFHYVFYQNFKYEKFMMSKVRNVLSPYLILSVISLIGMWIVWGDIRFGTEINAEISQVSQTEGVQDMFVALMNLGTGRTWIAYWYIPFVMLMFAFSRLFLGFINLPIKIQGIIVTICLVLAMFVHRPLLMLNSFHAALYYIGFYMAGIMFSQVRSTLTPFINRTAWAWVAAMFAVAAISVYVGQTGNSHKATPWEWAGLDMMVPLKCVSIFALIGICLRLEAFTIKPLFYIAEISFSLYFLHPIILWGLRVLFLNGAEHGALGFIGIFILLITLSTLATYALRKVLGKRSRYVIGS